MLSPSCGKLMCAWDLSRVFPLSSSLSQGEWANFSPDLFAHVSSLESAVFREDQSQGHCQRKGESTCVWFWSAPFYGEISTTWEESTNRWFLNCGPQTSSISWNLLEMTKFSSLLQTTESFWGGTQESVLSPAGDWSNDFSIGLCNEKVIWVGVRGPQ